MREKAKSPSWKTWAGVCAIAVLAPSLDAPSAPAASAVATPLAPGAARIWFYRDYEPYVSLNTAPVSLNESLVGYVQADGSAFYRDVAPGHYHITVASIGMDVNQAKDVDLAPGQEAYVKILASNTWDSGGDVAQYRRDTFYVSLVPPQIARSELPTRPLTGG